MKENDKDTSFLLGKGKPPEIKACLMHPHRVSTTQYVGDSRCGFAGVFYGLCFNCAELLKLEHTYQRNVDLEIHKRLNDLKGEY